MRRANECVAVLTDEANPEEVGERELYVWWIQLKPRSNCFPALTIVLDNLLSLYDTTR